MASESCLYFGRYAKQIRLCLKPFTGHGWKRTIPATRDGRRVAGRLGNTRKIAMRHYLMTTGDEFEAAVRGDDVTDEAAAQESSDKAAQNAAQSAHAGHRRDSHEQSSAHEKPRTLPG